jgi:dihydroorotase
MTALSRRHFLSLTGSAAAAALSRNAIAAMGPNDKFDLLIKGGEVLDPSQSLRGKRDVGIRWGVVEALDAEIPAAQATKTIDATGKLVLPGLVDLHCHVYPYGSAIGIPADELVEFQGTTTVGLAGDARQQSAALRRFIVAQTRARMYAFVPIANNGLSAPVAEQHRQCAGRGLRDGAPPKPDFLIGVKMRMSENGFSSTAGSRSSAASGPAGCAAGRRR